MITNIRMIVFLGWFLMGVCDLANASSGALSCEKNGEIESFF